MQDGRLRTDDRLRTNIPNVFAVGDIVSGCQELTPVAIRNGRAVARYIAANANDNGTRGKSTSTSKKDLSSRIVSYNGLRNSATAVFTPAEYGSIGLSEKEVCSLDAVGDLY